MKKNIKAISFPFYFAFFVSCAPVVAFTQSNTSAAGRFSHPAWSAQSNIYEVNLRQYTASSSIKEFEKSLPRLKKMGVEILWFMPITPIGIEGRKMTNESN